MLHQHHQQQIKEEANWGQNITPASSSSATVRQQQEAHALQITAGCQRLWNDCQLLKDEIQSWCLHHRHHHHGQNSLTREHKQSMLSKATSISKELMAVGQLIAATGALLLADEINANTPSYEEMTSLSTGT